MDKTAICNQALVEAEVDATISSVDTDESIEARRMRRIYDVTKKEVLSFVNWGFATKAINLARVETPVDCPYQYAYSYPSEVLRIVNIYSNASDLKDNNMSGIDYTEGTNAEGSLKLVFTDAETPLALAIVDVKDDILPPLFCKLFALYLALRFAKIAGASNEVKNRIYNEINEVEANCKEFNANKLDIKLYDSPDYTYYVDVRA